MLWKQKWLLSFFNNFLNFLFIYLSFFLFYFFTPFSPQFCGIQLLVATILSHRYNSRTGTGETKVMLPPIHNPTKPHCFLTQRASNPEASRTNVSEETPCTWQPWLACTAPGPPQESLLGANPESLMAQLALHYSALNHCATREAH